MPKKMVPKSQILGKHSLILVTIGTTPFLFTRLLRVIDNVLIQLESNAQLLVQSENESYRWKYPHVTKVRSLDPNAMRYHIASADKIITHCGFGTLFTIQNNQGVYPLIIPRQAQYHEHIDDHQVFFQKYIKKMQPKYNHKLLVMGRDLHTSVLDYLTSPKKRCRFRNIFRQKPNKQLFHNLNTYLSSL